MTPTNPGSGRNSVKAFDNLFSDEFARAVERANESAMDFQQAAGQIEKSFKGIYSLATSIQKVFQPTRTQVSEMVQDYADLANLLKNKSSFLNVSESLVSTNKILLQQISKIGTGYMKFGELTNDINRTAAYRDALAKRELLTIGKILSVESKRDALKKRIKQNTRYKGVAKAGQPRQEVYTVPQNVMADWKKEEADLTSDLTHLKATSNYSDAKNPEKWSLSQKEWMLLTREQQNFFKEMGVLTDVQLDMTDDLLEKSLDDLVYIEKFQKILETADKNATAIGTSIKEFTGRYTKWIHKLDKIPILSDVIGLGQFEKDIKDNFENQFVKSMAKGESTFRAFYNVSTKGLKGYITGGGAARLATLGLVKVIGELVELTLEADKRITEFSKSFDVSKDKAIGYFNDAIDIAASMTEFAVQTDDVLKAASDIRENFGYIAKELNSDLIFGVTALQKGFGLASDESVNFANNAQILGKDLNALTAYVSKTSDGLIGSRKAVREISKLTPTIAINFRNSAASLVKAVNLGKQFRLELEKVNSIGESVLDFEASLGREITANILSGKSFNMDQARYYQLVGDTASLQQEVFDQINNNYGSVADFAKEDYLTRKAVADNLGMTSDELINILTAQERLNKAGLTQEKFTKLVAEYAKGNLSILKGETDEARKMVEAQVARNRQMEIMAKLQASLNNLADKMALVLMPIVDGFVTPMVDGLATMFNWISKSEVALRGVQATLFGIAAALAGSKLKNLFSGKSGRPSMTYTGFGNDEIDTILDVGRPGGGTAGGSIPTNSSGTPRPPRSGGGLSRRLGGLGRLMSRGGGIGKIAGGMMSGAGSLLGSISGGFGAAASTVGGFLGSGKGVLGNIASKLSGSWKSISPFFSKFLRGGAIAAIIDTFMTVNDIQEILANTEMSELDKNKKVGDRALRGLGGILGSGLGTALGAAVPIAGPLLAIAGGMFGHNLGDMLAGVIAEKTSLGESIGGMIRDVFDSSHGQNSQAPIEAQDALIRPGKAPILFDKDDIVLAGTNLLGERQSNTSTSSASNSDTSDLEKLMQKTNELLIALINKMDRPVEIHIGGKVVDELHRQSNLRQNYKITLDPSNGYYA